jgi:predicted nucleic acid-binding protein
VTSSEIFVLDTNVIVSAVLSPRSVPRQAFDRAFLLSTVLVSDAILVEVDDVCFENALASGLSGDDALNAALEENARDVSRIGGS